MVEKLKVESSNVDYVGYSIETKELFVWFKNSKVEDEAYVYSEVDADVWLNMIEADSKGKFLNAEIRGKYSFEKRVV